MNYNTQWTGVLKLATHEIWVINRAAPGLYVVEEEVNEMLAMGVYGHTLVMEQPKLDEPRVYGECWTFGRVAGATGFYWKRDHWQPGDSVVPESLMRDVIAQGPDYIHPVTFIRLDPHRITPWADPRLKNTIGWRVETVEYYRS